MARSARCCCAISAGARSGATPTSRRPAAGTTSPSTPRRGACCTAGGRSIRRADRRVDETLGGVANGAMIPGVRDFLRLDAAGGICLFLAAAAAMAVANSPALPVYDTLLDLPMAVRIGTFAIDKPLLLWINDGLMAVFFLLIGLELKREMGIGALSQPHQL